MIPVAFTDPIWLWLLVPAVALVVGAWWAASRTLPRARRIASLVIRLALVGCIVASLAGARLSLPSDRLSVVFLVDASASMLDASREELLGFARQAVAQIPEGDTAGVVVFGGNALVDRLPSDLDELQAPGSIPVVGATDIAAAVRLGTAIFPAGTQQRLVLLSDGNDTSGQAEEAILSAAQRGVRLDVVLPAGDTQPEALVDGVDAPSGARVGETVELNVRVRSTIDTTATLRLLADGATVATRHLALKPGTVSVPFTVKADEAGFHVFRAVLEPASDHFSQNNAADAYVLVTGEPQVLVATDDPARAADLVEALTTARQHVTVVGAGGVPSSIATLAGYDAVVLDNVSAAQLGATAMASLQVYVRDLGKGLVMLGGRSSYGAGGYLNSVLEDVLPVYMTVRDRQRSPDVALVAVVDKSGSMADCHCTSDDRGTAQSGTRGFEKVDIAKEAILRAADALSPTDQLGVVAFDEGAHWAVHTGPIDLLGLQNSLGFKADGQTNIYAGLKAAYDDLIKNPAKLRHIILITDGWSRSGAYDALLADMKAAGITLSTIGTGGGSAHILRNLAEQSGGRYYEADDATRIPDIFLKETIRTAGEQIVEETFQPVPSTPSDILRGLDASRLPSLLGYNATTAKGTATVALLTGRDDPLLAQWQYGLGRSVAWTSDARQQWATPWIGTEAFGTLTAQLVAWTLPPQDEQGIDVRFSPGKDGELNVEVTSLDDDGAPRNFYRTVLRMVAPDLDPVQSTLTQVGPGRYAGTVKADQPGAYLVRVAQTRDGADSANRTLGVVSPAAEEFRRLGVDSEALTRYAAAGQGREITLDPADPDVVKQVWSHDINASAFPTPIWPWLLLLAMILVPIDVGVRRVALTRGDFLKARGWVARRVGLARPAPEVVPGLAELRAARGRSQRRADRVVRPKSEEPAKPPTAATTAHPVPTEAAKAEPRATANEETLAERLARRRRGG
ncbi:MAG TPA: VWA domain-containing protein [Methylomirabilota bacterium]|nr:VWA domain-containing protein [Methylomirabilota bacterium]